MKTDKDFIDFLQKELVDMIYDKKTKSENMKVFNKIVAKWKRGQDAEKERSSKSI